MAKIIIFEPVMGISGMFYYSGWVGDSYVHFLADYKMNKKEIKIKLLKKYKKDNGLEKV